MRKNYTVHKKDPIAKHTMNYTGHSTRNGFSSLLICPARITLYASCMDNIIYAYNISSYNPKPSKNNKKNILLILNTKFKNFLFAY